MFRHFAAGLFEDFAFSRGQALDAVRGNFVEDGVHLAFHKFVGGQFLVGLPPAERQNLPLPARVTTNSRGAARRDDGSAPLRPGPAALDELAHENKRRQNAAQMRGVGDVAVEASPESEDAGQPDACTHSRVSSRMVTGKK